MAQNLHATIYLQKQNTPIRPIINWKNAPIYELAKYLMKILHNYTNEMHRTLKVNISLYRLTVHGN
jgi:hypothetical protein